MNNLSALIARKVRLGLMIDLLNELASSSPSDQSQVKIDLLEELERLRKKMGDLEEIMRLVEAKNKVNDI